MLCRVNAVLVYVEKVRFLLALTDYATTQKSPLLVEVAGNFFIRHTEIPSATVRLVSIPSLEFKTTVYLFSLEVPPKKSYKETSR